MSAPADDGIEVPPLHLHLTYENGKAERERQYDFLGLPGLRFPEQSAGDEQDLG